MPSIASLSQHPLLAMLAAALAGPLLLKLIAMAGSKLLGMLPSLEKKGDAAIDGAGILAKPFEKSAAKLLLHHLMVLFGSLGAKALADAQASGKLDASTAEKIKADVLDGLKKLISWEFATACAKELGFAYSTKEAALDAVLGYTGHQVDNMIQAAMGQPTVTATPAVPGSAPVANPAVPGPLASPPAA